MLYYGYKFNWLLMLIALNDLFILPIDVNFGFGFLTSGFLSTFNCKFTYVGFWVRLSKKSKFKEAIRNNLKTWH